MKILILIALLKSMKILNQKDYYQQVNQQDSIVFFTDPGSRSSLQNIFFKLDKYFQSKRPNLIQFYEVEIEQNIQLYEHLDIQGHVFFLYKQKKQILINEFLYQDIKNHIEKLYEFDIEIVQYDYQLSQLQEQSDSLLIHYGDNFDIFQQFCQNRYEIGTKCVFVPDKSFLREFDINLSYNTAIYQRWSQKYFYLEKSETQENLQKFIIVNCRPLVEDFDNQYMQKFIAKNMTMAILFQPEYNVEGFREFLKFSYDVRSQGEQNWVFIVNNMQGEQNFDSFFGLKDIKQDAIFFLKFNESGLIKYKYEETYSYVQFWESLTNNHIPQYFKSQKIIPQVEGEINNLVGLNFQEIIESDELSVFLMYTLDNNSLMDIFKPIQKFNLIKIYQIDIYHNEVGLYQPPYSPAIIIKKSKQEFVPFQGELEIENVIEFIDEHLQTNLKGLIYSNNEVLRNFNKDDENHNIFRHDQIDDL